jgi:hypothetical protein
MSVLPTDTFAEGKPEAILGEWNSPKKESRVLIYRQGDKYYGKVTGGRSGPLTDEKNPDPTLRNRPVSGLVILQDFRY